MHVYDVHEVLYQNVIYMASWVGVQIMGGAKMAIQLKCDKSWKIFFTSTAEGDIKMHGYDVHEAHYLGQGFGP